MGAQYNQVLIHLLDANGRPSVNFWTTVDQTAGGTGAYSALAAAYQDMTYAAVVAIQYQTTIVLEAEPTTGDYQSVLDRAVFMSHILTTRQPSLIAIAAPKADLFTAGHEVVDMTDSRVLALSDEVQAVLGDTQGHGNGPLEYGRRQRARGQR